LRKHLQKKIFWLARWNKLMVINEKFIAMVSVVVSFELHLEL
jgi:hypothetical protein